MRNEKERFGALFRVYGAGPCRPAEFNMDLEEASACAEAVMARHSIHIKAVQKKSYLP